MAGIIPGPALVRMQKATAAASAAAKAKAAKQAAIVAQNAHGPLTHRPGQTLNGPTNVPGGGGISAGQINVPQIQAFLKAKGYDLPQTGKLDNKTKLALANFIDPAHMGSDGPLAQVLKGYRITGARNPQTWNQLNGTPQTKSVLTAGTNGATGQPNLPNAAEDGTVDLRGLDAIAQGLGLTQLPTSLAAEIANSTADAQYGAQIHDLAAKLAQDPVQAAQNMADLKNWVGQIGAAQKTAATRDSAISGSGISSMKDALAAIESSLGGSANAGTGDVAVAGANDIGTLQALGANQDQYNADLKPLLALEGSSQKQGQLARDATTQQADSQALQDAQAGRGSVYGSTYGSTLLNILGQNNTLKQTGFQNKLAIQQAAEAAQLSGLKALQLAQKTTTAAPGTFGSADPMTLGHVASSIQSFLVDKATGAPLQGMTPSKAYITAQQVASTYFPGGGVPSGWLQGIVGAVIPAAPPAP